LASNFKLLPPLRLFSRQRKDRAVQRLSRIAITLPLVVTVGMVVALVMRALPITTLTSVWDFLGGKVWHPLQGEFGLFPFIVGTLWVTILSMVLAVPVCLLSAIYLAEYAHPALLAVTKPIIDLLAGIPSVIYGVWGLVVIVPGVRRLGEVVEANGLGAIPLLGTENPTGFSVLAGGLVLAVMVAPVIISVTFEVLNAVPTGLRHASLAVGATRWQTIKFAVLPKAAAGILAGIVLGFSRAFGETMAVMMVIGNVPDMPSSIFDPAYPLTALIANNFGEMLSIPQYDAALMGAALILLVVVLIFNLLSASFLHTVVGRSQQ